MNEVATFLECVKRGDLPQVELMLSDKSLANAVTEEGVSALLYAIYCGHPTVAQTIAARRTRLTVFEAAAMGDADRVAQILDLEPSQLNASAPDGHSALGLAAFFGHLTVASLLLDRGADPNQVSANAMRVAPLHSAVANRAPGVALAMARLLLERGADPSPAQHGGWTPLHAAAAHNHRELAALLLEYGAPPEPRSDAGKTPAEMAMEFGFTGLADWLQGQAGGSDTTAS